jgi:DNA-binding CsgD family transcriptional regulator
VSVMRGRHMETVLAAVGDVYSSQSLEEFRVALLAAMGRIAPSDFVSYNEVAPGAIAAIVEPTIDDALMAVWGTYAHENPLLGQYIASRDSRAYRFSDLPSEAAFRRSMLYLRLYRVLGIEHQIAFALPSGPELTIGIALCRRVHDFNDDERDMLNIARPHLIQAYRNAQVLERAQAVTAAVQAGLEDAGTALMVVDADGTITLTTPAARALVEQLTGAMADAGSELPGALRIDGHTKLVRTGAGTSVLVRRVHTRGLDTIVLEPARPVVVPDRLRALGLTEREAAVLAQLAEGKSTDGVASELEISPRTVHKHTESIYRKLGVDGRAQAVATVWAAAAAAHEVAVGVV